MKRLSIITAMLFCLVAISYAQKQADPLPYNKEHVDSLFDYMPKITPLVVPSPEGGYILKEKLFSEKPASFETNNPGATVINKTNRGTIYNAPLDNMAVQVPDLNVVENMPGSNRIYKVSPTGNMPNPLFPKKKY